MKQHKLEKLSERALAQQTSSAVLFMYEKPDLLSMSTLLKLRCPHVEIEFRRDRVRNRRSRPSSGGIGPVRRLPYLWALEATTVKG